MEKSKFCVGLNGQPGNLEKLMELFGDRIYEVFTAAPRDVITTDSSCFIPPSRDELKRQIAFAHKHGVRYNVLMNGRCQAGLEFSEVFRGHILEFIDFLVKAGADCVTITNPIIMEFVHKNSKIEIAADSWSDISTALKARRFECLGAKYVTPINTVVKSLSILKAIKQAIRGELKITVNQGCLFYCDGFFSHINILSHSSVFSDQDAKCAEDYLYPLRRCRTAMATNPLEFLMNDFIRPEDIHFYEEEGIRLFKINGFRASTDWTVNTVNAYLNRSYEGNVFDLFSQYIDFKAINLPNKELDGWFEFVGDCSDEKKFMERCKKFCKTNNLERYFGGGEPVFLPVPSNKTSKEERSKTRFCVGLNGQPNNLETLLDKFGNRVYEVFAGAPPSIIATGRRGPILLTEDELKRQVVLAHDYGVRYNVLMNSCCQGGMEFSRDFQSKILKFIDFLDEIKADSVTLSNMYIIELVRKHSDIEIIAGNYNFIKGIIKAMRFDRLGVNYIVTNNEATKSLKTLCSIKEAVNAELKIIIDQGCLYQCDVAQSHDNMTSHTSNLSDEEVKPYGDISYIINRCRTARSKNPLEFLMCGFIRPEDIRLYEKQGFTLFKIASRRAPTDWTVNTVNAYLNRSYEGNVFDLFSQYIDFKAINLPNKELEGWIEFVGDWSEQERFIERCKEFFIRNNLQRYFGRAELDILGARNS